MVVRRLYFDRMVTFCEFYGLILRVSMPLGMEWFSFCILQLLERYYFGPVQAFVVKTLVCKVDWSAMIDQSWFPYE